MHDARGEQTLAPVKAGKPEDRRPDAAQYVLHRLGRAPTTIRTTRGCVRWRRTTGTAVPQEEWAHPAIACEGSGFAHAALPSGLATIMNLSPRALYTTCTFSPAAVRPATSASSLGNERESPAGNHR
ncbi:hypothetical protein GCM10010358_78220 [Streptomyces minutiscleroticus]|uniref:Uncharacterized protein n=1 Tax=Streptomyces minutiscleroticus TaxID=68238 RepID=A0A918U960_9ACTN|nr:hypothetical protein GCM10010358_78220 [Streptomyces minutiscleroticus]